MTKYMHFMTKDEKLFDKYMAIWKKVSNKKEIVNLLSKS